MLLKNKGEDLGTEEQHGTDSFFFFLFVCGWFCAGGKWWGPKVGSSMAHSQFLRVGFVPSIGRNPAAKD